MSDAGISVFTPPPRGRLSAGRGGLCGRGAAACVRGLRGRGPVPADAAAAGRGLRAGLVRRAAAGSRPGHDLPAVGAARHAPRVQQGGAGAAHLQVSRAVAPAVLSSLIFV